LFFTFYEIISFEGLFIGIPSDISGFLARFKGCALFSRPAGLPLARLTSTGYKSSLYPRHFDMRLSSSLVFAEKVNRTQGEEY
jgi:hypothetical protein